MQILLFRHGIAEDVGPRGNDASRRLTKEGIEKVTAAARGLRRVIEAPQALFTSPLVRAKQTADILAEVFDLKPVTMQSLAQGPADLVMRDARKLKQERVILVGHEPTLSELGAVLCTGEPSHFIELKKAGAMLIDFRGNAAAAGTPGQGRLLWLATPAMLRELEK